MDERSTPCFEDVARLEDAWVQNHLLRAPDAIVAEALDGAPAAVAHKLWTNLSERRRAAVARLAGPYPQRTRFVARQVLVCILWELPRPPQEPPPPPEPKPPDYVRLMRWLAQKNPAVHEAQERRREAIRAGILRRLLGPEGPPDG